MVSLRIEKEVELVKTDALELAINYSGCAIRQFLKILYEAAVRVRRMEQTTISKQDVEYAIDELSRTLSMSIIYPERIELLNEVRLHHRSHQSDHNELLIELILGNMVIVMSNGAPWLEVNPIIKNTVETHARNPKA